MTFFIYLKIYCENIHKMKLFLFSFKLKLNLKINRNICFEKKMYVIYLFLFKDKHKIRNPHFK